MANIQRTDLGSVGPLVDLDRLEGLERLDELAAGQAVQPADVSEIQLLERMLGLSQLPPQAGALSAPPARDVSLSTMSGPQIRGALRRIVLNFRLDADQLSQTETLRREAPELQPLKNRLGLVNRLMDRLDGILLEQDGILSRAVTEQKN